MASPKWVISIPILVIPDCEHKAQVAYTWMEQEKNVLLSKKTFSFHEIETTFLRFFI